MAQTKAQLVDISTTGISAGSASTPGITFTGDLNTGIYSPGADQVSFATGGTERLRIDSTGQIEAVSLGTAAAPTYSFTTDANTGIYSPGADQVAISTNGSGRLFVDSSGRVGVGTSSPVHKFVVSNGGAEGVEINWSSGDSANFIASYNRSTSAYLPLINYSSQATWHNGSVERMRLDSSGRLGIGIATPATDFVVFKSGVGLELDTSGGFAGAANTGTLRAFDRQTLTYRTLGLTGSNVILGVNDQEAARIDSSKRLLVGTSTSLGVFGQAERNLQIGSGTGATDAGVTVRSFGNNAFSGGLDFIKSRGTGTTNTIVQNGDNLGNIYWAGGDGTNWTRAALIEASVDGTPGANDMPGRLVFSTTADGASSPTERMRIANNGRLSVGSNISDNGHWMTNPGTDTSVLRLRQTQNAAGVLGLYYDGQPNNANDRFLSCLDNNGGIARCHIQSNGGIANYQANNSNLSDARAKKDIEPAANTWDCIKQWEIVNYRYKDQSDDADLNLGVIAQQVAESCPEVITVFEEAKEATETEPAQEERLGVKEQQMYWMAIKALQEAQVRIEALEAEVAALKAS